jgi:hypothetical protein
MAVRRSAALTAGIVLLGLISLVNILLVLIPAEEEGPPAIIVWGGVVLGVAGLVAAVGLWQRRRWALWTAGVVLVLGILSAAPGIPFASDAGLRLAATAGAAFGVVNLVLLFRPASRAALST